MVGGAAYAAALKSLWDGLCTITVLQSVTDASTGREVESEVNTYTDEPCRISFGAVNPTEPTDGASAVTQSITLYVDREVAVPEGSKITVTQNGVTSVYERSGKPAVYSVHQEIPLVLFKSWA